MAKAVGSSARFRQRKISVKQTLQVIAQKDIPDLEDEQQRELQQVETGVEKGEEEEHHLQAAINASNAASTGAKVEQVYIPTPDASKKWPEYEKYYPKGFQEPSTYIRLSATVEDTAGCPYCMDEEDEEFLKKLNSSSKTPNSKSSSSPSSSSTGSSNNTCSEDEFEMICHKFETMITDRQPFLTMDPTQLMEFEELSALIIKQINEDENDPSSPEYLLATTNTTPTTTSSLSLYKTALKRKARRSTVQSFKLFAKDIYPHWKERKIARGGKSIFPQPKLEESEKDDSDPYVCFRRREVRQVRKTRRADQQSSERLRKLQSEMESAKRLMQMVVQREQMRRDALQLEWDIFEKRCMVKGVKRKLGIKGEDEDLVAHKKKKEEPSIPKKVAQQQQQQLQKQQQAQQNQQQQQGLQQGNGTAVGVGGNGIDGKNGGNGSPSQGAGVINPASGGSAIHQVPAYVRLPVSKIPDMEMTLLEQVTRDKEVAIRTAVKNKLKSRSQQDREWVNYTDNPFVPYCDYFDPDVAERNNLKVIDPKHAAYSSIAAPYPPSCDVPLKLPLAASLGSSYASRVEASPILFKAEFKDDGDLQVESKITEKDMKSTGSYNVPRSSALSLRKRRGRGGRIMLDRRGLIRRDEAEADQDLRNNPELQRLEDRYKYDSDIRSDNMEFSCSDPSRLNGISNETQSIRFGSMLLSKSYESYRDAYNHRQQQLYQLQQKHLQQLQEQAAGNSPSNNNNNNGGSDGNGSPSQSSPTQQQGQLSKSNEQSQSQSPHNNNVSRPSKNNHNNSNNNSSSNSSTPIRNGGMGDIKMGTPPTKVEG